MLRIKLGLCCALAIIASLSVGTAYAQEPVDQRTYFTFSAPFELPGGKTLPAGKYTFRIVDSPSNRHVVQILSEDGTQVHATVLAIPAQRLDPPSEPEIRFMESAANMPPAVRTWWYPGRTVGHEFIYPKDQARRLAARQKESVLTVSTDATTNETMASADLARINAAGQESVWSAETAAAEVARGTETAVNTAANTAQTAANTAVTTAQSAANTAANTATSAAREVTRTAETAADRTASAANTAAETTTARTELPRTSTALPLVGLLGLASLLGAGALRLRRK
jgi:hypothetical protein